MKILTQIMSVQIITLSFLITLAFSSISHSSRLSVLDQNGIIVFGGVPLEESLYSIKQLSKYPKKYTNIIYKGNVTRKNSEVFIQSDQYIYNYELSRNGYLLITTHHEINRITAESLDFLMIYDKNGQEIKKLDKCVSIGRRKHFSWSPDGNKVAFIRGGVVPDSYRPFVSSGVWIYDIPNDKEYKISDKGVRVNWSEHDGNIYIQNDYDYDNPTDISVYDPKSNELKRSEKKGIYFSEDGKYYLGKELAIVYIKGEKEDYLKYSIFDNKTNEIAYSFKTKNEEQLEWLSEGQFIRGSHDIALWGATRGFMIFDADAKTTLRGSKSVLLGWNADMTKALVYDGSDEVYTEVFMTGQRLNSISIPK